MSEVLIHAKDLVANGAQGRIFGPLDLEVRPRQIVIVDGPRGSGKSALLLALAGRFAHTRGELMIDGVDAIAHPYQAMNRAGVVRLGNYVEAEDRLTLGESIHERCFLDAVTETQARERIALLTQAAGVQPDMSIEMKDLDVVERAVVSTALVMLRPTRVLVFDDVDHEVPHDHKPTLYRVLASLLAIDDACLVCSATDATGAPEGSLTVTLPPNHMELTFPHIRVGRLDREDEN